MKTIRILPYFMLICAIFLLTSCSAYQLAQWSAGRGGASFNNQQAGNCPHLTNASNNMGSKSFNRLFSMGQEHPVYCPKCGQYCWVKN